MKRIYAKLQRSTWAGGLLIALLFGACSDDESTYRAAEAVRPAGPGARSSESSTTGPRAGDAAQIVFDQTRDDVSSPFDTSFVGLSRLTDLLRRHGARVSSNEQPLDEFLPRFCAPNRVLVLGVPWKLGYSPADMTAVTDCLDAGAGVLAIVEHDDIYGHATLQNALLAELGIRALPTSATARVQDTDPAGGQWPWARAPSFGLESVRVFLPAPLEVRAPAQPLLELRDPADSSRRIVAALSAERSGTFAVLADLEILWNMTSDAGIRVAQNQTFLLHLFGRLAGRDGPLGPEDGSWSLPKDWAAGEQRALFESSGQTLLPDDTAGGILRLAERLHEWGYAIEVGGGTETDYAAVDLVVVALPLATLAAPERIATARRLLLIGDGQQDLLAASPDLVRYVPLDFASAPRTYPLDALARHFGVSFLSCTLLSATEDHLAVEGSFREGAPALPVYRSNAIQIDPSASPSPEVVASAAPGTHAVLTLSPVQIEHGPENPTATPERPACNPVWDRSPSARWPLFVRTPRAFISADFEPWTNGALAAPGGERTLEALREWLESDGEDAHSTPRRAR